MAKGGHTPEVLGRLGVQRENGRGTRPRWPQTNGLKFNYDALP